MVAALCSRPFSYPYGGRFIVYLNWYNFMSKRTRLDKERQELHSGQLMLDVLPDPIADLVTASRWFERIHKNLNDRDKNKTKESKAKTNSR